MRRASMQAQCTLGPTCTICHKQSEGPALVLCAGILIACPNACVLRGGQAAGRVCEGARMSLTVRQRPLESTIRLYSGKRLPFRQIKGTRGAQERHLCGKSRAQEGHLSGNSRAQEGHLSGKARAQERHLSGKSRGQERHLSGKSRGQEGPKSGTFVAGG